MIIVILLAIGMALLAFKFYKSSINHARYFEERNLKYSSAITGVRNLLQTFTGRSNFLETAQQIYSSFPDESIYGVYSFSVRQFIIRDPEVFKQIAIKDFDYFEDHRSFADETMDELLGNSLFLMHGEKWRQMRATLSPAFTGNKMRQMFELVSECADEVVEHFKKKSKNGERINIEMKDFFSRYTNDVIASCAFGVKVNSFDDPENEFYCKAKEFMKFFTFSKLIKLIITGLMPKLAKFLRLRIFDEDINNSFKSIILDTMELRQKNNISRSDMINIMMQVRQGSLKHQDEEKSKHTVEGFATVQESDIGKMTVNREWTDTEVLAQCFGFFFAGSDTVSTPLTFAAYELVINPDIQQKLYEEIAEMNEQINGQRITYDALQKLKYLDQVICETLRKWPSGIPLDRVCVKDYIYDDGNMKFKIEKGCQVVFTNYGVHTDPKFFPEPERFDPERFSDENKQIILSGTYYVPFGLGPRNCIGSRFALMELKAILYYLLLNFSFEANSDTQIPLKFKKGGGIGTERGVHLELKLRNH